MKIDPQIIEDCKRGDRKAQFLLYKRCFNILMGVCIRYKQDEDEAAATLNKGFLKILTNLDKYNPQAPFEAWIRRIMINTNIDEFRKNRKVRELIEYSDYNDHDEFKNYIDYNTADQVFDAEQLESYIKMLPPVSQKVFNLYAIDGYSHKEVGEMLGISDGTSKWHLSSARKKLQDIMRKALQSSKITGNG